MFFPGCPVLDDVTGEDITKTIHLEVISCHPLMSSTKAEYVRFWASDKDDHVNYDTFFFTLTPLFNQSESYLILTAISIHWRRWWWFTGYVIHSNWLPWFDFQGESTSLSYIFVYWSFFIEWFICSFAFHSFVRIFSFLWSQSLKQQIILKRSSPFYGAILVTKTNMERPLILFPMILTRLVWSSPVSVWTG